MQRVDVMHGPFNAGEAAFGGVGAVMLLAAGFEGACNGGWSLAEAGA